MPGVSAFVNLVNALDDLLGRRWDETGACYAGAIEEAGGTPCLSVFEGEEIEDDAGAGVVVEPDRETERRYSSSEVWEIVLTAIAEEFPEDAEEITAWPRTPDGYAELVQEFDLCFGPVARRLRAMLAPSKGDEDDT
jgi:hypothetical protein